MVNRRWSFELLTSGGEAQRR